MSGRAVKQICVARAAGGSGGAAPLGLTANSPPEFIRQDEEGLGVSLLRQGIVTGSVIGLLWAFVIAVTVSVALSFASGQGFRLGIWGCLLLGATGGVALVYVQNARLVISGGILAAMALLLTPLSPMFFGEGVSTMWRLLAVDLFGLFTIWPLERMLV